MRAIAFVAYRRFDACHHPFVVYRYVNRTFASISSLPHIALKRLYHDGSGSSQVLVGGLYHTFFP
jgi:hypothetical protein